jgi:hypothetical protein
MKSSPIIVENNLTLVVLYYQKCYPFMKHFVFQNNGHWNVIE